MTRRQAGLPTGDNHGVLEHRAWLDGLGVKTAFLTDEMGHSISRKELDGFVAWLGRLGDGVPPAPKN